ncbi:Suppressor of lethality of KEX2 GAS1 double null mutant protein 1 [Nakaseomyces bracarensis]|uniref:Suppressor of lethality of KEX2 GAS1 double null mutant protein 1 n=1 Tax=Nakaseomyces bracarensis TaxID=273131 RepID=A0ABR4NMK8_9SACH
MTGAVSTAVGCAVGIPVGIGVVVACLFWIRMQRRLKQEDVLDQELNRAVYDESGFVSFDNLDTMKIKNDEAVEGSDEVAQSTDLEESGSRPDQPQKRNSKYYVPAYKRKMNQHNSMIQREQRGRSLGLSTDSLSTDGPMNSKSRQVSVYDQMIPVLNDGSTTNVSATPLPMNTGTKDANESRTSFFHAHDASTNNSFLDTRSHDNLIKNLNSHDFGSYYPRRPSTPNVTNVSQSSFHTRNSSMLSFSKVENAENIFATPKSEDILKNANILPSEKMNSSVEEDNTMSTGEDGSANRSSDVYMLKNNYDMKNAEEITEEDQYENEFTNYSENKREFIDSLRPKM